MQLTFKKVHFNFDLFSKKIQLGKIEIEDNHLIVVSCYPYLQLCKKYIIVNQVAQDSEKTIFAALQFETSRDVANMSINEILSVGFPCEIQIFKGYGKFRIKNELEGIITFKN